MYRAIFSWTQSTDAATAGYYLYFGAGSGTYDDAASPKDLGNGSDGYVDFKTGTTRYFALAPYTSTGGVGGKAQEIVFGTSDYARVGNLGVFIC